MEPKVRVEQVATQRGAMPGRWKVTWRIENLGAQPLKILAARCPHGKFRCEEREITPAADLEPDQNAHVELEVLCREPSGSVVENAFLILRVLWDGNPWLILARLRVAMNGDGSPITATELITAQPVGFSLRETDVE
ncbi:MAG TPA: hypothetical protein VGL11_06785 [Candidatus Binatia bacterium]|jgi:hypothetical protein